MRYTGKHRPRSSAKRAVIAVGKEGGRGFIVETLDGSRLVMTAAHCLPAIPEAHPWANDRTWRVLAAMGKKPSIIADCCFVDPVTDIAVIDRPSNMDLTDAYDQFADSCAALIIGCLPPKTFAELDGWVLAPQGTWFRCIVRYRNNGPLWLSDAAQRIVGGMSGSPILANNGSAIGLLSSGNGAGEETGPHPRLDCHLPAWLLRNAVTKSVRARLSE